MIDDDLTPSLESFLRSARWRRIPVPSAEAREGLRAAFRPPQEPASEELEPYRIMVAWRLLRRTLVVKGLMGEDETIQDWLTETAPAVMPLALSPAPPDDPDSTVPAVARPRSEEEAAAYAGPWKTRTRPRAAIEGSRATIAALECHDEDTGLAVVPDPNDEGARDLWCTAAAHLARDLKIDMDEEGQLGLIELLDTRTVVDAWPDTEAIEGFEEVLLYGTLDLLVEQGEHRTLRHLRERYKLSRQESLSVVRMVRNRAREEWSGNVEEDRVLIAAKWKDYIRRAKEEPVGLIHEARGLKELAKVLGVTRTSPEDSAEIFTKVVAKVAEGAARGATANQTPAPITARPASGGETQDAEFRVIENVADDDAAERAALEKFDNE